MPMGNPADVPIGSIESRARARAMVDSMPMTLEELRNLTPAERRCRVIELLRMGQRRIKSGFKMPTEKRPTVQRVIELLRQVELCR